MMGESRNIWKFLAGRRDRLVGHVLRHPGILGLMMEGLVECSNGRGRPRLQYLRQTTCVATHMRVLRDCRRGEESGEQHQTSLETDDYKKRYFKTDILFLCAVAIAV